MVSAGTISAGLAGLIGTMPVRWRWERRTLGYQFRDALTAVLADASPTLSLDNTRPVLREVTGIELLESALPSDFDPTSDNIAIIEERFIAGAWREFPLGLYRLVLGDTRYASDGAPIIECDAVDLGVLLTEDGPSSTYTIASGTSYSDAAATVLSALGMAHGLSGVEAVLPTQQVWPPYPETRWWQVLHDLADGINYRTPWPSDTGRFRWRAEDEDPTSVTEATTYRDDAEPRLVDGDSDYRRRQDAGTLANICVVVVDDPFHPDYPTYVIRENADPTSPVSTATRQERRRELKWDSTPRSTRALLDAATAASIAVTELRREAMRYRTATLTTLPDPLRGAHEYYRLNLTQPDGTPIESNTLWRVVRWSRPLAPGGLMTHELEQVQPVAITNPEDEE